MKCELCHKLEAETAIVRQKDGQEEELYVCQKCAKAERARRQKRSQRTRKIAGLPPGVSMSVTEMHSGEGDEASEDITEILSAFEGAITNLQQTLDGVTKSGKKEKKVSRKTLSLSSVAPEYIFADGLHLEGLFVIGEIEAVERACHALDDELTSGVFDGVKSPGHVYQLDYVGRKDRAARVLADILTQERNARVRMLTERPRIFLDALCRALALLKNCRLLAPAEFLDLLSPLRLAAMQGMLDGITQSEIESLADDAARDMETRERMDSFSDDERDYEDAARADAVNGRFEDVVINEKGELDA